MIRTLILPLAALATMITAARADETQCVPLDGSARILASADSADVHPDWDGSTVGLAWTFIVSGSEKADGETYYSGELVDPKGNTVNSGVYILASEWDCG